MLTLAIGRPLAAEKSPVWAPIPDSAWALRGEAATAGKDMVILYWRLELAEGHLGLEYRIRISGPRGKALAMLPPLAEDVAKLQGRVVYPDGRSLAFESRRDFHRLPLLETKTLGLDIKRVLVAPPGLTDDCILDIRWEVPTNWRLPWRQRIALVNDWELSAAARVQVLDVIVSRKFPLSWRLLSGTAPSIRTQGDDATTYTFRDLPPREWPPYTLRSLHPTPRLRVFNDEGAETFTLGKPNPNGWNRMAVLYADIYEPGTSFMDLGINGTVKVEYVTEGTEGTRAFDGILKDLPAGPQAAALELALRLPEVVHARSVRTWQEYADWKEPNLPDRRERIRKVGRLGWMADMEELDPWDLFWTYLHLLRRKGLDASLVLAADRNERFMLINEPDPFQLGLQLVAVDEPGKPKLYIDPTRRFGPMGLVPPQLQGTQALLVVPAPSPEPGKESAKAISAFFLTLPYTPAEASQREDRYQIELQPERDRFELSSHFTGWEILKGRTPYQSLPPQDASLRLAADLEEAFPGTTVERALLLNLTQGREAAGWEVAGSTPASTGRIRVVHPFPVTPPSLSLPADAGYGERTLPVVAPYLHQWTVRSRIRIPTGGRWVRQPGFDFKNNWGLVSVTLEETSGPEGGAIEATLRTELSQPASGAAQWPGFRDFLEAQERARRIRIEVEVKP